MALSQDRMLAVLTEMQELKRTLEDLKKELGTTFKLARSGDLQGDELLSTIYQLGQTPMPLCEAFLIERAHFTRVAKANEKRRARAYLARRAAGAPEGVFGPPPQNYYPPAPPTKQPERFQPTPSNTWSLEQVTAALARAEQESTIVPDEPPPDFSKGIFER